MWTKCHHVLPVNYIQAVSGDEQEDGVAHVCSSLFLVPLFPCVSRPRLTELMSAQENPNQPFWSPNRRQSRPTQTPHPLLRRHGHLHGRNGRLHLAARQPYCRACSCGIHIFLRLLLRDGLHWPYLSILLRNCPIRRPDADYGYSMVYFLFPGTRGFHLETIDNIFLVGRHVFRRRAAKKVQRKPDDSVLGPGEVDRGSATAKRKLD